MELLAFLGDDKQTWGQVTGLINNGDWEKIILIKSKEAKSFPTPDKGESIQVNTASTLLDLKREIMDKLKGKFSGLDVNVSIASGNGKEHMALISALLSLPMGIRLTVFTKNGVEFIN
jgi:hypothetical protein